MLRKSMSVIGIFAALMLGAIKVQAEGWRGIVPLRSTRADVERLLGRPGDHGRYQFDKERAYIHYAGAGPCHSVNGCLCVVSEDTVISIYVELEVEMSFSALNLDRKKYKKLISPQDPTVATYSNDSDGIIYTVDEKNDDVTAIEYLPTAKDCQDVMRRANPAGVQKSRPKARCASLLRSFLIAGFARTA
jgi:hypothetical protein